ncbi:MULTISPECIES: pyruvate kinase [Flavobacteriaceae]|uniref:pyruvate kinase n=1 Tax=Flavobacteriaceae TaxID=49546 RepID=UPI001491AA7A|nr:MULTISPECIES: pyruvate kinase [Allomuricauda]MDC6365554.1 pyruvate kinase [Muricauda sp. AC10]
MSLAPQYLEKIACQIDQMIDQIEQKQLLSTEVLHKVAPNYRESAKNLLHYGTFRSFDAREMQKGLKQMGFTRLANAEGNILGSLMNLKAIIQKLYGNDSKTNSGDFLPIGAGKKLLGKNTKELFGVNGKQRRVRIMVTQPAEAANNYEMVLQMVKNGMDCARINCAHDDPQTWKAIAKNVQKASKACSAEVKIAVDLAGPKIRTGDLGPGPKVKKFKPDRNACGEVIGPAVIFLVSKEKKYLSPYEVPVAPEWIQKLSIGDVLKLVDAREKSRKLQVVKVNENVAVLHSYKTVYLQTGVLVRPSRKELEKCRIGELPMVEPAIILRVGDTLLVTGNEDIGVLPHFDANGNLVKPAKIPCVPSSVVSKAREGESILFDDGKIEGVIAKVNAHSFEVKITKANENGSKLKAEKGINFPTLDLGITGLTQKDREDLKHVVQFADIINYSYVNSEADVALLLREMEHLNVKDKLGIVLKIETNTAFKNLIGILLTAMQTQRLGVMIARGDLALEVGWNNMGMVQEGILAFCSAAHVPVIWATQVLESLAKKGVPSRSEITDITSSIKAECVMLNKGPYINEAITLLDEILSNMEGLRDKKEVMLPKIDWS